MSTHICPLTPPELSAPEQVIVRAHNLEAAFTVLVETCNRSQGCDACLLIDQSRFMQEMYWLSAENESALAVCCPKEKERATPCVWRAAALTTAFHRSLSLA